eukprot:GHVR01183642.1.p1 GENE.GHVR01183642.1~~GHVR01183642.1.p1  ORF type:complete len:148 (+),score=11.25 GHVR01183642.1:550-993(+)
MQHPAQAGAQCHSWRWQYRAWPAFRLFRSSFVSVNSSVVSSTWAADPLASCFDTPPALAPCWMISLFGFSAAAFTDSENPIRDVLAFMLSENGTSVGAVMSGVTTSASLAAPSAIAVTATTLFGSRMKHELLMQTSCFQSNPARCST